ncbi:MAG: hypothetical protein AB1644_03250 [Candidatus Zixiibacteriota bacterium]
MQLREPAVPRSTLTKTAAVLWGLVGIGLSARAIGWLEDTGPAAIWIVPIALAIGVLKGLLVFRKLAERNIRRIHQLSPHKEKICIFAFQAMQSYLLVILMVLLGILLRLSPIPREYLALIYLAIGSGLFIGSFRYWSS